MQQTRRPELSKPVFQEAMCTNLPTKLQIKEGHGCSLKTQFPAHDVCRVCLRYAQLCSSKKHRFSTARTTMNKMMTHEDEDEGEDYDDDHDGGGDGDDDGGGDEDAEKDEEDAAGGGLVGGGGVATDANDHGGDNKEACWCFRSLFDLLRLHSYRMLFPRH